MTRRRVEGAWRTVKNANENEKRSRVRRTCNAQLFNSISIIAKLFPGQINKEVKFIYRPREQ